jgi:hypothetical protein
MKQFDPTQLALFTGSDHYYRLTRKHLLTDGTKYLADAANAYWLMDAVISHLHEIDTSDWFVLVRLIVDDTKAIMIYEDGNGNEHARQEITYTNFPMSCISLYACFDGDHWVLMLPSEY